MKTFEEKPIVPSEIIDMHAHIYPDGCLYKIHKHVLINLNFLDWSISMRSCQFHPK